MLLAVLPHAHSVLEPERVLSAHDPFKQTGPRAPVIWTSHKFGPAGQVARHIGAKGFTELGEGEAVTIHLIQNTKRGHRAKKAVEGGLVGIGLGCKVG